VAKREETEPIVLEGDEDMGLHATWSRSGKRLILTISGRRGRAQVELRPDQVEDLATWLAGAEPGTGRFSSDMS
jgi:hypothetical protein